VGQIGKKGTSMNRPSVFSLTIALVFLNGFTVSAGEIVPIKCVGHEGYVTAVAVSPDGKQAASVSAADNTLRMWDTASGEELFQRDVFEDPARGGQATDVEYTPDGESVIASASGVPRFWDVETGKKVESDCAFAGHALDLAISPDGKSLAFARMGTVEIWEITGCQRTHRFPSEENPERIGIAAAVVFSSDGKLLAASYWGKGGFVQFAEPRVHVWDTHSGNKIFVGWKTVAHVWDVAISPNGKFLAAIDGAGQLRVWNFGSQEILYTIQANEKVGRSVAFSPDSKELATGGNDHSVKLWDVATGKRVREWKGHTAGVCDLTFSSNGKFLISGSYDNTMMIWPREEMR